METQAIEYKQQWADNWHKKFWARTITVMKQTV